MTDNRKPFTHFEISNQYSCVPSRRRKVICRSPLRIDAHDRVIVAIGVEVKTADGIGSEVGDIVDGDKPADLGIVVSGLQVVQPGFGIVVIPAIAEGIQRAEVAVGAVFNRMVTPRIVGVFYHDVTVFVKQGDGNWYIATRNLTPPLPLVPEKMGNRL